VARLASVTRREGAEREGFRAKAAKAGLVQDTWPGARPAATELELSPATRAELKAQAANPLANPLARRPPASQGTPGLTADHGPRIVDSTER